MQRKVSAKKPGETLLESSMTDEKSLANRKESAGEESSILAKFSSFSAESWSAQSQISSYEEPEKIKPEEKRLPRCIIT
jgi:hypothetical protein